MGNGKLMEYVRLLAKEKKQKVDNLLAERAYLFPWPDDGFLRTASNPVRFLYTEEGWRRSGISEVVLF